MKAVPLWAVARGRADATPADPRWHALRNSLHARVAQIGASVREWRHRRRSRAELATLDHRMLRDIGVTPAEALHEANKPFWRP